MHATIFFVQHIYGLTILHIYIRMSGRSGTHHRGFYWKLSHFYRDVLQVGLYAVCTRPLAAIPRRNIIVDGGSVSTTANSSLAIAQMSTHDTMCRCKQKTDTKKPAYDELRCTTLHTRRVFIYYYHQAGAINNRCGRTTCGDRQTDGCRARFFFVRMCVCAFDVVLPSICVWSSSRGWKSATTNCAHVANVRASLRSNRRWQRQWRRRIITERVDKLRHVVVVIPQRMTCVGRTIYFHIGECAHCAINSQ